MVSREGIRTETGGGEAPHIEAPGMLDHVAMASTTPLIAAFCEAVPEPVLAVSGAGRVLAANRSAKSLLPALKVGGTLALALRDPGVRAGGTRGRATGSTEQVVWRDRVPVERVFEVTIAPLDRAGEDRAVVLTLKDLTEAVRVERMRADFVANASHELRTPLASLLGFVETLQGPARDDARARDRFLAIMGEQARRMARLIDDLLSLSRIEQHLHLRPSEHVDLAAAVRHVADTLGPLAHETGVRLTVRAEGPAVVAGDWDELVRVAENLIENAVKYGASPTDDRVEIAVDIQRRDARLTVRDHGPGIAAEHIPRLTERFYRIDAGQSRRKGGTGLGLAIVKHIVARHRGHLRIESQPGHGSLFTVTIPLQG